MLRSHGSPFRVVEPSGDIPAWVDDDPFEDVVVESISVGLVLVHTPHLTNPIAPFTGFAMQAEVVKSTGKYTEFRKAQKKTFLDKVSKATEESEGGLFFASRERGRNSQVRKVRIVQSTFLNTFYVSWTWRSRMMSTSPMSDHHSSPPLTISRWTYRISASHCLALRVAHSSTRVYVCSVVVSLSEG